MLSTLGKWKNEIRKVGSKMSANLKIGIIADDSGAQQKFEELSTSIDYTSKTVTQLANQFARLNESNVKLSFDKTAESAQLLESVQKSMAVTANQLMNAIERQKLSWGTNKDSVEALKKELSELEKVETLLIQKGVGSSMSGDLKDLTLITNKYEEYKSELKEAIKLKEEEEEKRRSAAALAEFEKTIEDANLQNILAKNKALKEFTLTLQKAGAQQEQYNKKVAQNFSTGSMSTASSQTIEYQAQGLLGNQVAQLKNDYEAYYQQLLKVIAVYGVESSEAKNLATKLNGLEKEIKSIGYTTTSTAVRIKNLVKNFVSAQMVVWAIRKAFNAITNTLKESSEAASQAEETYNLFITTFETVATTAENTATRLASSIGMANSTAQKALGTFGDLAAGYGATDKAALEFGETATEVALDIISYKNITGDLDTTFQSIASGLAGNVENFRKLGYVMTQAEVKTKLQKKGLDKLTGSALQYAQIQARLEILQEKSVKAQGDMIKTLDSTENVTRRLSEAWLEYKENLGKTVNTVLTPLKKHWLELLEQINKANKAQENFLKNGSGGGVYDVDNNEKDRLSLQRQMQREWGNFGTRGLINENSYGTEIKKVISLMETFSTTPDTIKKMFIEMGAFSEGNEVLEKIYSDLETAHEETIKKLEAQTRAEEKKNKAIETIQSSLSLLDNLNSITGVWANSTPISQRLEATQGGVADYMPGSLDGEVKSAISDMIKALSSTSSESFVSALDLALGKADLEDQLKAKLSSVESVYETLWNDFYSEGGELTEWQKSTLESLLDIAKQLNKQIEEINTTASTTYSPDKMSTSYEKLNKLSSNVSSALSAYNSIYSSYGGSNEVVQLLSGWESNIEKALKGEMDEATYKAYAKYLAQMIGGVLSTKLLDADSLSMNPEDYVSALDKALGNNSTLDGLENQLDTFTDFYELAMAYYNADGVISAEEQNSLNSILEKITGIQARIGEENAGKSYSPDKYSSGALSLVQLKNSLSTGLSAYQGYSSSYGGGTQDQQSYIYELEDYLSRIESALNGELTEEEYRNIEKESRKEIENLGKILELSLSTDSSSYITDLDKALGNDSALDGLEKQLSAFTDFYNLAESYYKADGKLTEAEQNSLTEILSAIYGIQTNINKEKNGSESTAVSDWDSWQESFTGQFDMLTSGIEGLGTGILELLTQTDLFQQSLTFISDTILPVLNAYLEPVTEALTLITESIQTLLCDALEPFYKLLMSVVEPIKNIIVQLTTILSDFINMVMQPLLSIIEAVVPVIVYAYGILQSLISVCEPLFEIIGWIMNLLTPLVEMILKPIMNTIKWIFELLITGFTYIEVFFKKVIGHIGAAFLSVWNSIVSVLRSINLLGWKPFENMGYADTSKMDTWKNLNYQDEVNKKLNELNNTVKKVYDAELTVADNTSKDVDLSILNDLLKAGIITGYEYEALANNKLGLPSADPTRTIRSEAGQYVDYIGQGKATNVSYGDISIEINGTDASPEEIAREVSRILDEWRRNGRATFATY